MDKKQELTDEEWHLLEEAQKLTGKPRRELLREALGPILSGVNQDDLVAASQKKRRAEAFERLHSLPAPEPVDDGVSASTEHDEILYGGK